MTARLTTFRYYLILLTTVPKLVNSGKNTDINCGVMAVSSENKARFGVDRVNKTNSGYFIMKTDKVQNYLNSARQSNEEISFWLEHRSKVCSNISGLAIVARLITAGIGNQSRSRYSIDFIPRGSKSFHFPFWPNVRGFCAQFSM